MNGKKQKDVRGTFGNFGSLHICFYSAFMSGKIILKVSSYQLKLYYKGCEFQGNICKKATSMEFPYCNILVDFHGYFSRISWAS